jgi:hypothetical protein
MSDLLCTSAMCAEGKLSVQEMRSTFDSLQAQYPNFQSSFYEPTVVSIEQAFNANYSWFSSYIPFNPECCAIKDIGAQADTVTQQMLASVNAAPSGLGPGSTTPPISLGIGSLGFVVGAGLVLWLIAGKGLGR